ncbi:3-oxoacyl-ACP synthase [Campylobacter armoricus]|uniref:3-oxoacyl-ACP synthase n=1 Tax=Campylobacter armoricus TaxID=2505970 RepID=UPI002E26AA97
MICWDFALDFYKVFFKFFLTLNHTHIQKVVLICASVKSKAIDTQKDKITFLNNSDSASAILIEKNTNTKEEAFFSQKVYSAQCLEETLPFSKFNSQLIENVKANNILAFSFIMQNYPVFFQDFFDYFKLEKNNFDEFFIHSSDNFSKQKLYEKLNLHFTQDEILKKYGNTTINKLPLEIASYAVGGGISKFSLEVLEQVSPLMHVA